MTKKERETIDTIFDAIRQQYESVMQPDSPYSMSGYASPDDQMKWDAFFSGYLCAREYFLTKQAQKHEKDN